MSNRNRSSGTSSSVTKHHRRRWMVTPIFDAKQMRMTMRGVGSCLSHMDFSSEHFYDWSLHWRSKTFALDHCCNRWHRDSLGCPMPHLQVDRIDCSLILAHFHPAALHRSSHHSSNVRPRWFNWSTTYTEPIRSTKIPTRPAELCQTVALTLTTRPPPPLLSHLSAISPHDGYLNPKYRTEWLASTKIWRGPSNWLRAAPWPRPPATITSSLSSLRLYRRTSCFS